MKPFCRNCSFIPLLVFLVSQTSAQQDTSGFFSPSGELNKNRLWGVVITEGVGYPATMYGLNLLWYKQYPKDKFHFFNDNAEWLQMDKIGHVATAYYVGYAGMEALKWSGVEDRKALWYGGNLGLLFLTTVEVFDGFSAQWGASSGDVIANVAGTAMLIGQEYAWNEQRILMKFSYHDTEFAQHRPETLGGSFPERILKDYNGQTYWLSGNISSFIKKEESKFPKWLNVAIGYSANGMTGGNENPPVNSNGTPIPVFQRQRQFYLSVDVDLRRIKTKSRLLKALFGTFGFIKFPAPALELNEKDGFMLRAFYF